MKLLVSALTMFASLAAFASSTVCSGDRSYYSNFQFDYGAPPPKGAPASNLTIVFDGKVLLRTDEKVGEPVPVPLPAYSVKLNAETVLKKWGTPDDSVVVTEGTLVIVGSSAMDVVSSEPVTCRKISRHLP